MVDRATTRRRIRDEEDQAARQWREADSAATVDRCKQEATEGEVARERLSSRIRWGHSRSAAAAEAAAAERPGEPERPAAATEPTWAGREGTAAPFPAVTAAAA